MKRHTPTSAWVGDCGGEKTGCIDHWPSTFGTENNSMAESLCIVAHGPGRTEEAEGQGEGRIRRVTIRIIRETPRAPWVEHMLTNKHFGAVSITSMSQQCSRRLVFFLCCGMPSPMGLRLRWCRWMALRAAHIVQCYVNYILEYVPGVKKATASHDPFAKQGRCGVWSRAIRRRCRPVPFLLLWNGRRAADNHLVQVDYCIKAEPHLAQRLQSPYLIEPLMVESYFMLQPWCPMIF